MKTKSDVVKYFSDLIDSRDIILQLDPKEKWTLIARKKNTRVYFFVHEVNKVSIAINNCGKKYTLVFNSIELTKKIWNAQYHLREEQLGKFIDNMIELVDN